MREEREPGFNICADFDTWVRFPSPRNAVRGSAGNDKYFAPKFCLALAAAEAGFPFLDLFVRDLSEQHLGRAD